MVILVRKVSFLVLNLVLTETLLISHQMMNLFITDLCQHSQDQIERERLSSIDDVRNARPLIGLSDTMLKKQQLLKNFLRNKLYLHPRVKAMTDNAQNVIEKLFKKLIQNPKHINVQNNSNEDVLAIMVSDYIAGMTDRFALQTFERICK